MFVFTILAIPCSNTHKFDVERQIKKLVGIKKEK